MSELTIAMNEMKEAQKCAEEALVKGFIEWGGKKFYHRISTYYKNCDNCPVQDLCCYQLSKYCMEYETKFREKWGIGYSWKEAFMLLTQRPHMDVEIPISAIDSVEMSGMSITFDFNDGCWVCIDLAKDYKEVGAWQIQTNPEDEETYAEGGIWFNGEQIEDYDGCYDLPKEVKTALSFLGYHLDE